MKSYKNFEGLGIKPTLEDYIKQELIAGVIAVKLPTYPSEGGDFAEYLRINDGNITIGRGENMVTIDGFVPRQISRSYMVSGIIKAWHIHAVQNEIFFPTDGRFIIGLYDNRKDSDTFGKSMKIYAGKDNPMAVFIPAGVAHGYKNIGKEDCLLIYVTDQQWDGRDEGRLPWDSKEIDFNWDIANG